VLTDKKSGQIVLTAYQLLIDAHERQLFDKLLWGLVTSTIFVRC
jgi:hypothetical protein